MEQHPRYRVGGRTTVKNWKTTGAVLAALGMMAAAAGHLSARGGAPTPTVYDVTSTLFDADAFANPTLVQGDDPLAGGATYQASAGVISEIDTNGGTDWNLDLRSSARGFSLTLTTTDGGAVPGLPSGPTFYQGRIVSRCYTPAGGTTAYNWFHITDDPNCAMRVNFASGSTSYTLVMSPGYAGTGTASVHCNAFSGSSCVDWTVTPNPNATSAGVANLYSVAKNGSEKFAAACRLTFRMHVTYP
jgi:hypothetical protein